MVVARRTYFAGAISLRGAASVESGRAILPVACLLRSKQPVIDSNPATDREATCQPIDNTPMHPEYPCAHCILSGSISGVIKAVLGTEDIPEIAITSPAAPGVTHRFTNLTAFTEEVANARIWAGFHYRFSTRVGTDMGRQIGEYVVKNVMQPAVTAEPQQLPRQGLVPVAR